MSRMPIGPVCWGVALTVALASDVHADGMFVWRTERQDILEPEQKAVLLFDQGVEELVLEVRYAGAVEGFGWIVPLPSVPRVRADDPDLFAYLSMYTQETPVHRASRGGERTMSASVVEGVDVLERVEVGVYDVAILSARSGEGLTEWLREHSFRVPHASKRILDEYAARGWVFAAMRVRLGERAGAGEALREGTLQPVRFRFATPEPVFPLRISALGGGRTTVLLYVCAARPLVHRTCNRAEWLERVGYSWPKYHPELDPDSTFRALSGGAGQLTKLRVELSPEQMEDVYFREVEPGFGAASADPRERLESVALLRAFAPEGAAAVLARMLERPGAPRAESIAVCEALGGLSDTIGTGALVRAAFRGSRQVRIEATDALARRRCPEVLPLLARECREWSAGFGYDHWYAMKHLIAWGHPGVLPYLEEWSRENPDPVVTRVRPLLRGGTPAQAYLALRAAAGDDGAIDTIVADILAESGRTTAEEVQAYSRRMRGESNGRPNALGLPLVLAFEWARTPWPALQRWHGLLAENPARHDEVLRRAASTPGVPALARATLRGLLARPTAAEAESVLVMATRSLRARRPEDWVMVGVQFGPDSKQDARFHVPVTIAALSLQRMRAEPQLLALWRACETEDPDTRGEVATALASFPSDSAFEAVVEYVERNWDAWSRSDRHRAWSAAFADTTRPPWQALRNLDIPYRLEPLLRVLDAHADRDALAERLMLGPTLSPVHRMAWMLAFRLTSPSRAGLRVRVMADLDQIERDYPVDSFEWRVARAVRTGIQLSEQIVAREAPARVRHEWK